MERAGYEVAAGDIAEPLAPDKLIKPIRLG
jgi:hypothetical protein